MINHKLLHDPRETVAGVRQLYARVRATAYAVLIAPTPTRSRGAIARDVLRGLGKHLDGRDTPRTTSELNDAARVWLEAHEITTLIIRNADRLDPSAWQEVRAITPRSCRTWLWVNPGQLTQAHAILGKRLGLQKVTMKDLTAALRWPPRPRDPVLALADDTPCPTIAAADFPVFALACQPPGNDVSWANFIVGRTHVRWYTDRIARRLHW
jgi:hypothetical protein